MALYKNQFLEDFLREQGYEGTVNDMLMDFLQAQLSEKGQLNELFEKYVREEFGLTYNEGNLKLIKNLVLNEGLSTFMEWNLQEW